MTRDGQAIPPATESFPRRTEYPPEGFLAAMEASARERHIPIIRPETAALLRFLVALAQPRRILEIGTAIGYSTATMAQCQPQGGCIDTIELDGGRVEEAESNFHKLGLTAGIHVLHGDARDILPCLSTPYDLVFVDAAKGQYPEYLEPCLRLVRPGGILVADNVLFMGLGADDGGIGRDPRTIPRKHRTIAVRLQQFLMELRQDKDFETAILPLGDGVTVSCRKMKFMGR